MACAGIYVPRAVGSHLRLESNAFDLSVFDYALWSSLTGNPGHVPFLGHSLFSHHFMPTLLALLPAYSLFAGPELLIAAQLIAFLCAAVVLTWLASGELSALMTTALVVTFCFSRKAHSALSSPFYLESFEPLLVFGVVWAWSTRRWYVAAACSLLLLGCKEDAALYLAFFGVLNAAAGQRRAGFAVAAVSVL